MAAPIVPPPLSAARAAVLAAAASQLGVPYAYGGGGTKGPSTGIAQGAGTTGYDCAAFMQYAFYQGTLASTLRPVRFLARGTQAQAKEGLHVGWTYDDIQTATPGDVIFFNQYGHCGLLVSLSAVDQWGHAGPQIIHAPHTGSMVKYENVYPNEGGLVVTEIRRYVPAS